jgi:endonuclease III
MSNRLRTVSISTEAFDKKNAYIKELETRLRLATSPERAKQLRDHNAAMLAAIDGILSTACRGTRAMQMTQQLCVPLEKLDAARKALKEPAIKTVIGEGFYEQKAVS